ncbi:PRKR-interacting protein 1 [Lobulomyces angularis]|nr:PRKR-interacting protein 1 [Lobulomyces angularis]
MGSPTKGNKKRKELSDELDVSDDEETVRVKRIQNDKLNEVNRAKLERMFSKIDKPVYIPDKPKPRKLHEPPEFVIGSGSSAGAGSGEFHQYSKIRRREFARTKFHEANDKKIKEDLAYQQKLEEMKKKDEEKTSKNREKRKKKKEKKKEFKLESSKNSVDNKVEDIKNEENSTNNKNINSLQKTSGNGVMVENGIEHSVNNKEKKQVKFDVKLDE